MPVNLMHAHAMVMVAAWMIFGSTGILFARYGRSLRCGGRRQLLGKAVWFQAHRLLLSFTPLLTLLGFLLILVYNGGQWVQLQTSDVRKYVHSIFGGIIVCCCIVQVWLSLYRCHPQSRFRYLFNWSHRIVGLLSFGLFMPTIFLMTATFNDARLILLVIISCWTGWMAVVVVIFEKIRSNQQATVLPLEGISPTGNVNGQSVHNNMRLDNEASAQINTEAEYYNRIKILLLFVHGMISAVLSVLFVVFLCV